MIILSLVPDEVECIALFLSRTIDIFLNSVYVSAVFLGTSMHHSKLFSGNDPMSKINKNTQMHQSKVVFYKHFRIVSEICA